MIDHHCHPFALAPASKDLEKLDLNLDAGSQSGATTGPLGPMLLARELLRVRLARHLGCSVEEVDNVRTETANRDYEAYVRGLFADAGIGSLILDAAWPLGDEAQVPALRRLSGCKIEQVLRVDGVIDECLEQGVGFDEIDRRFDETLRRAETEAYVGFKTVLAYRTGLDVDPEADASRARKALHGDRSDVASTKPLRDYLTRRLVACAADVGLPIQFHTGIGDSDLRLSRSHPLLLDDLLATPEGSAASVVLLHGAYPHHEEVAYLSATRRNVWVDLSLFNLFAPARVADRLLRIMELAPVDKLLVGSDGHGIPESHWFAMSMIREGWNDARTVLQQMGVTSSWLDRAGTGMFEQHARELYGLAA